MNQKFKKIPVRGITAKEVLALWQEGRLYTENNAADCSYRAYLGKGVEDEIRQELKRLKNCFLDSSF